MKVEDILQVKGNEVVSVIESDSIRSAASTLGSRNIGAVIVKGDGDGIVGILSERDIVRHVGSKGADALNEKIAACMTPNPFTCTSATTIDELMKMMTDKRIRHMPVVDNGALIGVVSIGDVVKRKIQQAEQEAEDLKEYISG